MQINVKFHANPSISFCTSAAAEFVLQHRPTDRYFVKIMKYCSKHPKTFKSFKNQKLKISTAPVLPTYTEYKEK